MTDASQPCAGGAARLQANNGDAIVAALTPDPNFDLKSLNGGTAIQISCKSSGCPAAAQLPTLKAAIEQKIDQKTVSPPPLLVATWVLPGFCPGDPTVGRVSVACPGGAPRASATNAAAIVNTLSPDPMFDLKNQNATTIQILCKNLACLTDPGLGPHKTEIQLKIDALAERPIATPYFVILPVFCMTGNLQKESRTIAAAACPAGNVQAPTSNVGAIVDLINKDPNLNVSDGGNGRLLVACKDSTKPCDTSAVARLAVAAAKPSPAFIQEEEVAVGTADTTASGITKSKPLGITADAIGPSRIRLKSDNPIPAVDVDAILQSYLYGGSAPPLVRMFYQPPTVVVPPAMPPASSSSSNTSSNSGSPGNSAGTSGSTGSNTAAGNTGANATGSQNSGSTTVSFNVKSETSASSDGKAAPAAGTASAAAPTTTTTATTATITPAPPASPPASPSAPQIIKDMVAVNDNVVFNDTSSDSLVWQRARLLTLLDLPRPEVLMNVWSYQATSSDGREILRSAESVRDLVNGQNGALQNAIQFGWAYLSREMERHVGCADLCGEPQPAPASATAAEKEKTVAETKQTAAQRVTDPLNLFALEQERKTAQGEYDEALKARDAARKNVEDAENRLGGAKNLPDQDAKKKNAVADAAKVWRSAMDSFGKAERQFSDAKAALDHLKALTPPLRSAIKPFFNPEFYNYITQKFVDDSSSDDVLGGPARQEWGFCPEDQYCLGYAQAFQPVRPNLTSILLGAVASQTPLKTILTTIGCMEGKYEVYPECFPGRPAVKYIIEQSDVGKKSKGKKDKAGNQGDPCSNCTQVSTWQKTLEGSPLKIAQDTAAGNEDVRTCLREQRHKLIEERRYRETLSCETLDRIAVDAQERCGVPQTLPLSCFTLQAAQSFSSDTDFSTFTLKDLNELAEVRLADIEMGKAKYRADRAGLLRAGIADFLFHYKMSQQYPKEFPPYDLQHSTQELNAELNPLVVSFNQDVAAFSQHLSDRLEREAPDKKSFLSDGIITIRGIGGDQSTVDTTTQNYFKVTQSKSLAEVLNALNSPGGGGSGANSTASIMSALEKGTLNPTTAIAALAAITPSSLQAQIGRQLTLTVTPHTLPGASSAELDVILNAGDSGTPSLYSSGGSSSNDPQSHIAKLNVTSRVRVESVKMFELSSFSAMVQRPRGKFPLLPPFVELPWIGSLVSLPLRGARQYHRSTAIVSAVVVPTATDLAYGLEFTPDRKVTPVENESAPNVTMRAVNSLSLFKEPIRSYHKALMGCFATKQLVAFTNGYKGGCESLSFRSVPREF
jgi:hypothetical protein